MNEILLVMLLLWLGPGILATTIAAKRQRGLVGALLGFGLGFLGLLIVLAVYRNRRPCPSCRELLHREARICPHCRKPVSRAGAIEDEDEIDVCAFERCARRIPAGSRQCPHCGRTQPAAVPVQQGVSDAVS
ncbi:hypothetical protein [Candidatus Nitrospira bockiana]